jgi:hypothetical protein
MYNYLVSDLEEYNGHTLSMETFRPNGSGTGNGSNDLCKEPSMWASAQRGATYAAYFYSNFYSGDGSGIGSMDGTTTYEKYSDLILAQKGVFYDGHTYLNYYLDEGDGKGISTSQEYRTKKGLFSS